MQEPLDENELLSHLQRVDELIEQESDPDSQARLQEIVRSLLEFHGEGLRRVLQCIDKSPGAREEIVSAICEDRLISNLLVLHDLHPVNLEARVKGALEKARPYLASHGGHIEFLSVTADGAVHLRLEGSCHGCPSSRVTLQSTIEKEIYAAAPEITSIAVEGLVEEPPPMPTGFVPLERIAINGNVAQVAAV